VVLDFLIGIEGEEELEVSRISAATAVATAVLFLKLFFYCCLICFLSSLGRFC